MKKSETISLNDLTADVLSSAQKEDNLLALLRGDVVSTAKVREAERHARIDEENRRYAGKIDEAMQMIVAAGGRTPADLSDIMATRLFRDKLAGFRYPAFEELLPDGTPRLRPAGDRLDGLRPTDEDARVYKASSVEWRVYKILKMLRAKTAGIGPYSWENASTPKFSNEPPKRYVSGEVTPETVAETAEIKLPEPKKGRPSNAAKKLAKAKAKQEKSDA